MARMNGGVSATALLVALVGPATLHAQDQVNVSTPASAEDIVVTARFKNERLQDVSQAISAVAGDRLQATGSGDLTALSRIAPGLDLTDRGPSRKGVGIRGISRLVQLDDFVQSSPTVGLYLDDTPYATTYANQRDVPAFDLEGVEVLRGPQGTLYGEGSMAGTIKFNSRHPDLDDLAVRASGGLSSTKSGGGANYQLNGALNLPLVTDRLAVRLVGYYHRDDGFIDRAITGRPVERDVNDSTRLGGRLLVKAQLTDSLDVTAGVYYDRLKSGASWVTNFTTAKQLLNNVKPGPENRLDESRLFNLRANLDLAFGVVTSITGYGRRENDFTFQDFVNSNVVLAATPARGLPPFTSPAYASAFLSNRGESFEKTLTQEVRFVSDFSGPFQLTLGAYYRRNHGALSSLLAFQNGVAALDFTVDAKSRQIAGFGEASYAFSPTLTARAGLRYFDERLRTRVPFRAPAFFAALPVSTQRNTISELLPRFTLEYKPQGDVLIYASAAKGSRNGGFNSPFLPTQENAIVAAINARFPLGAPPIPVTFPDPQSVIPFDADSLWTYEAGAKLEIRPARMTLNVSAYYTDWKNLQIRRLTPVGGITQFDNLGKARAFGVEAELRWRVTDALTFTGNMTLGSAETASRIVYRPGVPQLGLPDLVVPSGSPLPSSRDLTYTIGADYVRSITSDIDLTIAAGFSHYSSTVNELGYDNSVVVPGFANILPGYGIGSARIGLRRGPISLTAYVDNIANKIVPLGKLPRALETYVNRPRTIGITLSGEF